jgi:hypothetical protein
MKPRLLTEAEYKATFSAQMIDIKGRESIFHPEGVLDLTPYLLAIKESMVPLELLSDAPSSAVYHSPEWNFDHVLYPCDLANTYLVVVVAQGYGEVHGHYILDLNKEYGLRPGE